MTNDGPNVRQIAKLAGVSIATVSRVYRGVGPVSAATRAKVQAAIEEHGYRPSHFGEALANRRHGALGIIFPGLSGPYFAELIDGVESVAVPQRISVHVLGTHMRRDAPEETVAFARRVDGVAVHGGTVDENTLSTLAAHTPVVTIGADPNPSPIMVRTDDHLQVRELVGHLLADHGLKRLIFVGNPEGSPDISARWQAFRQAHVDHGRKPPQHPLKTGLQQADGILAADGVLKRKVDGAVCANDETAIGLMIGALGHGRRVPEDLVITGIDDVPLSALVRPGLTTVARPVIELGATATRLLLDRIAGKDVPPETVLPSHVIRRASCGCPPDQ